VAQGTADQIGALFGEREFARDPANAVGPEQLPLLAHKKNRLRRGLTMITKDDK
jgi:hypothetical protein